MKQNGTDPKGPGFFKKLGILVGFIVEVLNEIFYGMSEAELQHWSGKKDTIRKDFRKYFKVADLFVEEKELWRKFYQKHFSLDVNFADVIVPPKPTEGKWRLLFIAEGLTMNQVYDCMKALFACWGYTEDLDKSVTQNARDTKKSYAIWVRDEAEPDTEFLNKSTRQADPDMKIGVTLTERMIHEIDYFSETGKHLDEKGVTFCSGSRCSDGGVPSVYLCTDGEVRVHWDGLVDSYSKCGVRRAVYS
jgi:hypothetical protein